MQALLGGSEDCGMLGWIITACGFRALEHLSTMTMEPERMAQTFWEQRRTEVNEFLNQNSRKLRSREQSSVEVNGVLKPKTVVRGSTEAKLNRGQRFFLIEDWTYRGLY